MRTPHSLRWWVERESAWACSSAAGGEQEQPADGPPQRGNQPAALHDFRQAPSRRMSGSSDASAASAAPSVRIRST